MSMHASVFQSTYAKVTLQLTDFAAENGAILKKKKSNSEDDMTT